MNIRILIVSKNPVKIQAVKEVFTYFFEKFDISTIEVRELDSSRKNLKHQPIGEKETYNASKLRVQYAQESNPNYNYYIGIEGGIALTSHGTHNIIVYCSIGNNTSIQTVRGCEIPLPSEWYNSLLKNPKIELGDLVSEISGIKNIKQKQGAVGFLTRNNLNRYDILKHCVTTALIPFLHPNLYGLSAPKK
jgi:inosine/xanthosine triphosphatase